MEVKVIAHSKTTSGAEIVTIECTYPYYVHAQVMTHRVFSRNGMSFRAIPVKRIVNAVKAAAIPKFMYNKSGMQAAVDMTGIRLVVGNAIWRIAKSVACSAALALAWIGVHKQWANRLIMPFAEMRLLITTTELSNFYELRIHGDAQGEINQLGVLIRNAIAESTAVLLNDGEWHLPYINNYERDAPIENLLKMSTARCARLSYLTHDRERPTLENDLDLYHKLIESKPMHASPSEHQAMPISDTAMDGDTYWWDIEGITHVDKYNNLWSGNFRGFIQHRQLLG